MRNILFVIIIVLISIFVSCKRNAQPAQETSTTSELSSPVSEYERFFNNTFDHIENLSIKNRDIDWINLKETVKDSINSFNNNEDVYNAIGYIIDLINDGHSIFIPPQDPDKGPITNPLLIDTLSVPSINRQVIANNIGYIKIPGFLANDSITAEYTLAIRKALIDIDTTTKLSGWVIDLRNNNGGEITSASLGLSPLFEEPLIGILCDNKDTFVNISSINDCIYWKDIKRDSLSYTSVLNNKNRKIAVLVNKKTASAGEFLALAFKFQKNTKLFGEKTKGLTSGLRLIDFYRSNAKILLATYYCCDKERNILNVITPDFECDDEESLEKAIDWIKQHH